MASIKTESFISTVCQAMLFWITLFWSVLSGPIRTEPVKFENAALFLWLGLPSTLIRYENSLFENVFKLEEIKLNDGFASGRVWTEKFENGAFRRRPGYENHLTSLPEFSSNTNPKWPVIVAFLIFSGVVCTGPRCAQSLSVHRASVCTGSQRAQGLSVHRASACTGPQCAQGLSVHRASVCTEPQCAEGVSVHRASVCTGPQCTVIKMPFNDSL